MTTLIRLNNKHHISEIDVDIPASFDAMVSWLVSVAYMPIY